MSITKMPADRYGDYNLGEFGTPCLISNNDDGKKLISNDPVINDSFAVFMMHLRRIIARDRRSIYIGGKRLTANINWLRDHIHEMKGYKHWEYDLKSYLDFMIKNQHESGFFYEITCIGDNFHTKTVDPPLVKFLPEENLALVKIELEADIEYLVVDGAVMVYQATGDEQWIKSVLPNLEKGIDYITSDPKRWDEAHGLVKRPFTIDTWDFLPNQAGGDRRIYDDTPMSIMHGDNTGVYKAMTQLAWLNDRFGNSEKANEWRSRAAKLLENLNKYCWNGNFYTHQIHLNHNGLDDKEDKRLSLSNTYALTRGTLTNEQGAAVIESYLKQGRELGVLYEWCAIYPPYETFNMHKAGSYINGGSAPFLAGELAKGAFRYGYEKYGYEILKRLQAMHRKYRELGFLYNPETGDDLSGGPNGWGAAAVLDAIDNGFAGIEDADVLMNKINLSPRFVLDDATEKRYYTGYDVSDVLVELEYKKQGNKIMYALTSPAKEVNCHILLPENTSPSLVSLDGEQIEYKVSKIRNSTYVDFKVQKGKFVLEIEVC
ncbi:MAG: hypothetical protein J6B88_08265 [Clostridia bacterium]|nr:hypothetical protein [Clostridia bacterium]